MNNAGINQLLWTNEMSPEQKEGGGDGEKCGWGLKKNKIIMIIIKKNGGIEH